MSRDPAPLPRPHGAPSRRTVALFAAVLILFVVENIGAMRVTTATSDETSHLPAGYSYLATGDYRLNPQHPPLAKILAAIPLLALAPHLDTKDPAWTASPPDEWQFGERFLYGNDAGRLLFWGRLPIVLTGLLACLYVGLWARALFGDAAGLSAAALFALCPTVVGHAHLVTMDVPLAAFAAATLYHLRAHTVSGRSVHLLATGVALGAALATKFSAGVYVPAIVILLIFGAASRGGTGAARRATIAIGAVLALAALVVWIVYRCPADPFFYLEGLMRVNRDHDPSVPDYLLGEFRLGGWWYYFPVAFALKTPLPTLMLIVAGVACCLRFRAPSLLDEAILFIPAVLFLVATAAMAAGIGVRYVIPLYVPLIVSASRVIPPLLASLPGRLAGAVVLVWLLTGAARIHPDYLAYFNEAAGGPERGPQLLDDSNLDWGGGLSRLKGWMDANGVESVRLLYPWNGSPAYYGIHSVPVTNHDWLVEPSPGVYAISTVALVRGRLVARESGAKSDWLDRYTPVDRVGYAFRIYRFDGDAMPAEPSR